MTDSLEHLAEEGQEQYQGYIRNLRLLYREDGQKAQRLARIHQRLLESDVPAPLSARRDVPDTQQSLGERKSARPTPFERRPWQRRLSALAAVLVAALLVSSLLLVLTRSHRSSPGSTSAKVAGGLSTLLSIHMLDAATGWALTDHAVLYTSDGAVHWKDVTPAGIPLSQSSIADFRTASVASIATPRPDGASTQVLHTADGGSTWQQAIISMPFPRQISFVDAQHGWLLAAVRPTGGAAEPVAVFRTADGGKTWTNIATALFADTTPPGRLPYGGQKSGMRFLDASTGWVTGTVPLANLAWLYITHDGGSTWHQQALLMPPGLPTARLSVLAPTFFSAADGILPVIFTDATTDSPLATALYTTHDGGTTWSSTVPVPAALPLLSIADMQHGWATDGTLLYSTSDGGAHWLKLSPGASFNHIAQLDFVSATLGWAISSPTPTVSSLLKTVDGGRSWTTIPSPAP
jgi:photosystem II stability/assembly factor-like uncharacterized protein